MRKVYSPPPQKSGWFGPILGALFLTLVVFLVLPLTQMVSSGIQKRLVLSKVDSATLAPPVDEAEPPPPPPPPLEEEPPPPPPSLSDTPPPMNMSVDLDIAVGAGGALAGFGNVSATEESTSILNDFDVSELESKPEVVSSVPPRYPSELRRAGIEGRVTIVFVLDTGGRVEDPRIETSTQPEFEQPALEAVRKWKFRPGMKDGEAVRTFMRLPIAFRMNS